MKKLFIALGLILLCSFNTWAQDWFLLSTQSFNKKEMPAVEMRYDFSKDRLEEIIDDYFKKTLKIKFKKGKNKSQEAIETEWAAVSADKMDIYMRIVEAGDGSKVFFSATKGYDLVLSTDKFPDEFLRFQTQLKRVGEEFHRIYYTELVEKAEKDLAALQKEKEKLEEKINSNQKKIESNKETIEKLNAENTEAENIITESTKQIEGSIQKIVEATKNVEELKKKVAEMK